MSRLTAIEAFQTQKRETPINIQYFASIHRISIRNLYLLLSQIPHVRFTSDGNQYILTSRANIPNIFSEKNT